MAFKRTNIEKVFSLRKEVTEFLTRKHRHVASLQDINWLCDLFLLQIIGVINKLNLKLQGNGMLISALLRYVNSTEKSFIYCKDSFKLTTFVILKHVEY